MAPGIHSWPILVSTALVLFMGIVALRGPVVRAEPRTAILFELVGLPVNLAKLDIALAATRIVSEGDRRVLVVEGEVLNQTAEVRTVPPMKVEVRGGDGHAIYAWTTNSTRQRIEPGERAGFSARLISPPADGALVAVEFDIAQDKAPPARSQPVKRAP
jgi:hypothetical protein